jgi:hypothetical protein
VVASADILTSSTASRANSVHSVSLKSDLGRESRKTRRSPLNARNARQAVYDHLGKTQPRIHLLGRLVVSCFTLRPLRAKFKPPGAFDARSHVVRFLGLNLGNG